MKSMKSMKSMKKLNWNLLGLVFSVVVIVAAPLLGVAITALFLRSAFGQSANVDPSQKARVLAEGISAAINGTVYGLVVSCLALVPVVIFSIRLYRDSKRAPPPP